MRAIKRYYINMGCAWLKQSLHKEHKAIRRIEKLSDEICVVKSQMEVCHNSIATLRQIISELKRAKNYFMAEFMHYRDKWMKCDYELSVERQRISNFLDRHPEFKSELRQKPEQEKTNETR